MSYDPSGPYPPAYPPPGGYGYPPARPGTNGLAIAGFVLSFFCSILSIIFCAIALNQIGKTGQGGRGLAIAGLIISVVSIVFSAIYFSTR